MAEQKFLVDINFNENQARNMVLHKVADVSTLPVKPSTIGMAVYNEATQSIWYQDDVEWVEQGGVLSVTGTSPIVTSPTTGDVVVSITEAVASTGGSGGADNGTPGTITGKNQEKLNSIEWNAAADQNSSEVDHINAADSDEGAAGASLVNISLNNVGTSLYAHKNTIVRPHNEVKYSDQVVGLITSPGNTADWASEKQIVDYVTSLVGSGNRPVVPFDPTGGSGTVGSNNLPLGYDDPYSPGAGDIQTGDQFVISQAGTVGSGLLPVNPNDTLIANTDMTADSPDTQTDANWTVIAAATVQSASESVEGIAFLTNEAEMDFIAANPNPSTPGDDLKIVTPYKLQYYQYQLKAVTSFEVNGIAGTTLSQTATHNLNNLNVDVFAYLESTGEQLYGQVTRPSVNTANITFNTQPGAAWSMVVHGVDNI